MSLYDLIQVVVGRSFLPQLCSPSFLRFEATQAALLKPFPFSQPARDVLWHPSSHYAGSEYEGHCGQGTRGTGCSHCVCASGCDLESLRASGGDGTCASSYVKISGSAFRGASPESEGGATSLPDATKHARLLDASSAWCSQHTSTCSSRDKGQNDDSQSKP